MPKRSIREKIISAQTVAKYFFNSIVGNFLQTKRFGSNVHIVEREAVFKFLIFSNCGWSGKTIVAEAGGGWIVGLRCQ